MKIFLSWSGAKSKKVAESLKEWLPSVIQSLDPWYSPEDIQKGTRWTQELADSLETSPVGVFCLTSDNLAAPWLLFEAGAISKASDSRAYTLLLDIRPGDVEQPLGQFNHTVAEKEDLFQFLVGVNAKTRDLGERSLSDEKLRETFEIWWPALEKKLDEARALSPKPLSSSRPVPDVLQEVLELLRNQDRRFSVVEQDITRLARKPSLDATVPLKSVSVRTNTFESAKEFKIMRLREEIQVLENQRSELAHVLLDIDKDESDVMRSTYRSNEAQRRFNDIDRVLRNSKIELEKLLND